MDNQFNSLLLYPLFIQVLLTFSVGLLAFKARISAVKSGQVPPSYFKHNQGKAPEVMLRWGDHYQNQFELPVLFYALIGLLLATEINHWSYLAGAWLFVISRIVHSFIHIKTNHVLHRMRAFSVGFYTLFGLWIGFIIHTFSLDF